ncbi:hypothetical protein S83_054003 [Arachis hypogaea]
MLAGPDQWEPGRVDRRKRRETQPAQDATGSGTLLGGDSDALTQGRSARRAEACRKGNRGYHGDFVLATHVQLCAGMVKDNGALVEQFVIGRYGDGGGGREWNSGNHDVMNQIETNQPWSATVKTRVVGGNAVNVESCDSKKLGFEEHETVSTVLEVGRVRGADRGENAELREGRGKGHEEAVGGVEGAIGDVSDDGNYGDIDGENGSEGGNRVTSVAEHRSRANKEIVVTEATYGGCGSKIG